MGEIEALYRKVYFANSMDQILKETILIMLRQMIIGGGGTVPDLSNYPTKSEMQLFVGDAVSTKVDLSDFNIQIGTINTSLTNKLESTDLQPIRSDLSTLSGTVNTKVSLETFNGSIANLDGKISNKIDATALTPINDKLTTLSGTVATKVSTETFNNQIGTINTELGKKLETVDFSEVNQRIGTVDSKVDSKVDTLTFNNQITVTNNKISTDINTAKRSTMEEVNRDYLPRAEYADLGIQLFDADKRLDTRDFKIFTKTVTTYESGLWECDFSEAGFNYPPQIFVTAHARNKGEAAGDATFATIIPMYSTKSYVRGRLSSANSDAMVNVSAEGDVTVVAIGQ